MTQRQLAVSGQFYPNEKKELVDTINQYKQINYNINFIPRAIISPHAGYIYSGFTANQAFCQIPKEIKTIVVIGPSHKFRFDGISISNYDSYPTPQGSLTIDTQLIKELSNKFNFISFIDQVHCEHSTETQMPFIRYHLPTVQVVEMIYSNIEYQDISKLIATVLENKNNFIVISTDLSHFHTKTKAKELDDICIDAISTLNIKKFDNGCEACGLTGVKAIVDYANKSNYKVEKLDYRTSADITNDDSSVVGYCSFLFG